MFVLTKWGLGKPSSGEESHGAKYRRDVRTDIKEMAHCNGFALFLLIAANQLERDIPQNRQPLSENFGRIICWNIGQRVVFIMPWIISKHTIRRSVNSRQREGCWTPVNSSWLNLVESYFASLQKTEFHNTDFKTLDEIERSLLNEVQHLNENPKPYVWKKI